VEAILREYQLTPGKLLEYFQSMRKQAGETYTMFGTRLEVGFTQYLKSRKVEVTDGNRQLLYLMISDKIKGSLPLELFNMVRLHEIEKWLEPRALCQILDTYDADRVLHENSHSSYRGAGMRDERSFTRDFPARPTSLVRKRSYRCAKCGSPGHFSWQHETFAKLEDRASQMKSAGGNPYSKGNRGAPYGHATGGRFSRGGGRMVVNRGKIVGGQVEDGQGVMLPGSCFTCGSRFHYRNTCPKTPVNSSMSPMNVRQVGLSGTLNGSVDNTQVNNSSVSENAPKRLVNRVLRDNVDVCSSESHFSEHTPSN